MITRKLSFLKKFRTDLLVVLFLLVISAIPRIVSLDKIPLGIHGDEGWNGIIAREILAKGSVPAYIEAATGIPSGSIYPTALVFKIFGENIFLLRISSAIAGILTIVALYIFLRLFFERKVALLTAISFNFSLIHIHYSRVAFGVIFLPLLQLMSLIFIILARKKNNLIFVVLSAIFAGLSLHIYHVANLFPVTIIFLLFFDAYKQKFSTLKIKQLLLFIFIVVIVSLPILKVMIFQPNFYFSHLKTYSVLNEFNIKNQNNLFDKSGLILKTGFENTSHFFLGNRVDNVDAFGKYYNFNRSYLVLFLFGIILSFINGKKFNFFILFSFVFFLTPTFLTFEGTYRRSILSLIYFYYFFAIAINWILNIFKNKFRKISLILITILIVYESLSNLYLYFNNFPKFFSELTESALLINNKFTPSNKIYLFSDLNPCNLEIIRYLNNKYQCEDRSTEFGVFSLENIDKPSIILLINRYTPFISEIKSRFKNGQEYLIKDHETNTVLAIIYKI